jgi:hypothetical protein
MQNILQNILLHPYGFVYYQLILTLQSSQSAEHCSEHCLPNMLWVSLCILITVVTHYC